jgi:hypothetical protein
MENKCIEKAPLLEVAEMNRRLALALIEVDDSIPISSTAYRTLSNSMNTLRAVIDGKVLLSGILADDSIKLDW